MTRLIAGGMSAAEAAQTTLADSDMPAVAEPPIVGTLAEQLRTALDRFDGASAHAVFDRLLASVSVEAVVADVVLPYLRDLGDRWAAGHASVAQEHFGSTLIRGRLLSLARDWDMGEGPSLLLACLPGEAHDIGLLAFGLLAARRGWRITFLGADTPLDTLRTSVETVRPQLTVLVTINPALVASNAKGIRALASSIRSAIGGVSDERLVARAGAAALPDDIVEAARSCHQLLTA